MYFVRSYPVRFGSWKTTNKIRPCFSRLPLLLSSSLGRWNHNLRDLRSPRPPATRARRGRRRRMSSTDAQESTGWEELRKEARKIEGDLDVKLSSYAKLASIFTHSSGNGDNGSPTIGSNRSWKSMEMEIGSLLEKLLDVNDAMSRCAASTAATTSINQKLARHRDILHEFTQEFRRTKGNLNSMREHAELLNSVRDDITESKGSGGMSPRVSLLRERAAIHGNISDGKVKQLGDKFPVIRGVLGAIRRKRSKDSLILSAVIAVCIVFIIIYWLSK
ncbi:Golgi SNAP receptor complex member 1-2-like isoform X2 [Zingiber officinale]|uniref:Golgi SNAP receptor complex member 1-2-like isoform X2 n=1 Tax=Zingiber officinale TaxID=94328 RepID=UPI001C4C2660|nr:Golgi SNAP receptor complex member 1-2-like isoform X2 [Zingiber officinale]